MGMFYSFHLIEEKLMKTIIGYNLENVPSEFKLQPNVSKVITPTSAILSGYQVRCIHLFVLLTIKRVFLL